MKLLLAIDSSAASQQVVDEVAARPWPTDLTLCAFTALDTTPLSDLPALIDDAKHEAELALKTAVEKLARSGLSCQSQVTLGHPRRAISAYAADWGADWTLLGSHGHTAIGRFLLGSVAQAVLRTAPCSVEIVRRRFTVPQSSSLPMKVLVATDGSEFSADAVRSVAARPWPKGTQFQILSVEDLAVGATPLTGSPLSSIYPVTLLEELLTDARNRAIRAVEEGREILQNQRCDVVAAPPVPSGDPRVVILDTAQAWPADLIVLGSHGRRGLDRLLMGSVAESVAVHAHCSVEVVRSASKG